MGHQVHLVGKVHPDLKVVQACPVVQDKEGSVVIRDRKVKDYQDQLAIRVILDLLEDHLARRGLKGHKVLQEFLVNRALQDRKDLKEPLDLKVLKAHKGRQDLLVPKVFKGLQAHKEKQDLKVSKVLQDLKDQLEDQQVLSEEQVS